MKEQDMLYGQEIDFITNAYMHLIKNIILFKYDINSQPISLKSIKSHLFENLNIIQYSDSATGAIGDGVMVGTIRMGYGHHRMAYALYSNLLAMQKKVYLHDLLGIESNEAMAIKEIDGLYSHFSRMSSEWGGITEWLWGQLTSKGNISSLKLSLLLAENYVNLISGISRNVPYLSTYPLNGQIAQFSGFKKVIHLVCDNYPQYYLLVPGALNLVQSQSSYMKFIEMGVPKESLFLAGHWVSHDILSNIAVDSVNRINRAKQKVPKRMLLAIGGAGAQKNYTSSLLEQTADMLKNGNLSLMINTGDHKTINDSLKEELTKLSIPFHEINSWEGMKEYCKEHDLSIEKSDKSPVTLFNFANYYEAFTATDILIRCSDVLITKPSELAFYPVPKIFIRRVGDHEAASAFRSVEIGDGTTECREPSHAVEMIKLFNEQNDIYIRMNDCIIRNDKYEIYSGAKKAAEMATN